MIADKPEHAMAQADKAAKAVASIIIVGILAMFSYGILHWVIFE